MEDQVLINKIKELKNIKPEERWVVFCRGEIKKEIVLNKANFWQYLFNRPVLVGITTFVFALTGGLATINAAWGSLPGDSLYPIKLAMERAQLRITSDKARFQAEITGRRAQELTDVANLPVSLREEKITEAVSQIERQLQNTQQSLPELKDKIIAGQEVDKKEIAETVKIVQQNATKLKEAIDQANKNISEIGNNKILSDRISDISEKLNQTNNEITEIIDSIENHNGEVEKKNQNDGSPTKTSPILPKGK